MAVGINGHDAVQKAQQYLESLNALEQEFNHCVDEKYPIDQVVREISEKIQQLHLFIEPLANDELSQHIQTKADELMFNLTLKVSTLDAIPQPEQNLAQKAQDIFEAVRALQEAPQYGQNTAEGVERNKGQIRQLRGLTQDEKVIQILSRAEGIIEEIQQILQFNDERAAQLDQPFDALEQPFDPNVVHLDLPQQRLPAAIQTVFAQNNQYSGTYAQYYENIENYQRSACTPLAGLFVMGYLQGDFTSMDGTFKADQLEQLMKDGQILNAKIMRENPPEQGEHHSFADLLIRPEFAPLDEINLDDPFFVNVNILEGKDGFSKKLINLQALAIEKGQPIGIVLSARGESYGLVFSGQNILFFDSHGHQPLTGSDSAYVSIFKSPQQAAEFLAQRMPVVNAMREYDFYNTASFTPVCMKQNQAMGFRGNFDPDAPFDFGDNEENEFQPGRILQNNPPIEEPQVYQIRPRERINLAPNNAIQQEEPQIIEEGLINYARTLNEFVNNLSRLNIEGFELASILLFDLASKQCQLPISGTVEYGPKTIADNVFFHLYHIQNKETPDVIDRNDPQYGTNAFQNDVTPAEVKLRSAQRVMIEVAFQGLTEAIEQGNDAQMREYLEMLEKLDLDPKDLPNDVKNIVYYLYGKLYENYLAAYNNGQVQLHPHDPAFKGDFGRFAFRNDINAQHRIDNRFKLDVIRNVQEELKGIWIKY
jgi:hypothetical protein